jgi:hypothetical protein
MNTPAEIVLQPASGHLEDLPRELLTCVFRECSLASLGRLRRTCQALHQAGSEPVVESFETKKLLADFKARVEKLSEAEMRVCAAKELQRTIVLP